MAVVIFDDFEYVVGRNDAGADALFQAQGWAASKLENGDANPGANGWMYTVTSIPGFAGTFPGGGSRVLAMEMIPAVEGPFEQTDAWLQLDDLPGDLWIQYWVYPQNHAGSGQLSSLNNSCKWFYFAREGYPSHNHALMVLAGCFTHNPLQSFPWGDPTANGEHVYWFGKKDGGSTIQSTAPGWDNEADAGPSTIAEYLVPNRWTLVKWHIQTLGETGNKVELWLRAQENEAFIKVMDYEDGVDGFQFTQPTGETGGHATMRWPSVIDENDFWCYIDDFIAADDEDDLPTYGSEPPAEDGAQILGGNRAGGYL